MQEMPNGQDRRLVFQLLHHWREARGERLFPKLCEVYERSLGEILVNTFELTISEPGEEPLFARIGEALQAELDISLVAQPISKVPRTSLLAHAVRPHKRVLKRGLPICIGGDFTNASGRLVLFRTIVMPVSEDGVRIAALLGGANERICEPGERAAVAAADSQPT